MSNISRRQLFGFFAAIAVSSAMPVIAKPLSIHEQCLEQMRKLIELNKSFRETFPKRNWDNPDYVQQVKYFSKESEVMFRLLLSLQSPQVGQTVNFSDFEVEEARQVLRGIRNLDEVWNTPQTLSNSTFAVAMIRLMLKEYQMPICPEYLSVFTEIHRVFGDLIMRVGNA